MSVIFRTQIQRLNSEPYPELDISNNNPFQNLDIILMYMNTVTMPPYRTMVDIKNELKFDGIIFGRYSDELMMMLNKLEKDGMIRVEIHQDGIKKYYQDFDGNLFLSEGGYHGRHLDTIRERSYLETTHDIARRNSDMVSWGAFWAAVIALCLLIVELVKFSQACSHCKFP